MERRLIMIDKKRLFPVTILFSCLILFLSLTSNISAANCVVNSPTDINFGSGDSGDLRYCIGRTNANPGADSITFEITGTIALNSSLPVITDSVSIVGSDHAIVVDGQDHLGIIPISVSAGTVTLSDITITRGHANNPDAGGIEVRTGASLDLTRVTIDNCTTLAENGGGIVASNSTLKITNSRIINNHMSAPGSSGSGIYQQGGSFVMTGSVVSNNSLPNSDDIGGAGIHLFQVPNARIENSTISNNVNGNYGAGIHNNMSNLKMSNVTISGNSGGMQAGGVSNVGGSLTLRNCTISSNSVQRYGGGIYNVGNGAVLTLANTIVSGNSAGINGQDVYNFASLSRAGTNIVQVSIVNSGTITGTGTIVNVDPRLLPLASNGGLVQTRALALNSQARNAGVNAEALDTLGAPLLYDARGAGYPRIKSQIVDLGAYESSLLRSGFNAGDDGPRP
jgi:hypothetical protein